MLLIKKTLACVALLAASTAVASAQPSSPNGRSRLTTAASVPDEILVKFSALANASRRAGLRAQLGATAVRTFGNGAEHWRRRHGSGIEMAIERLRREPDVEYAEPNFLIYPDRTPVDPRFSEQWNLLNIGQSGGLPGADISAAAAWSLTTGGTGVTVAVIDTGVDIGHDDLWANLVSGYDFADNDPNPFPDLNCPGSDHGTHVAGIIGAVGNNDFGGAGVAWTVRLMPLKVFPSNGLTDPIHCDDGNVAAAVAAIDYAGTHGAAIINTSWGWTCNAGDPSCFSQTLYDAIARWPLILFTAGAGDSGADDDSTPHYPASFDLPNIISTAFTTQNDALDSGSNYGATTVDLGAPGRNILSTLPPQPPPMGTLPCEEDCPPSRYGYMSGSSMAAPHVAGTAALLLSVAPSMQSASLKSTILACTDSLAGLSGRTASGGRLNAAKALEHVLYGSACSGSGSGGGGCGDHCMPGIE